MLHGLRMHLFFHLYCPRNERRPPLSWHVQRYGVTECDGSSMVPTRPLAKQETPTPSGIANMDYLQSPPAVASPLRPCVLASLADGQSRHSCTTSAAGLSRGVPYHAGPLASGQGQQRQKQCRFMSVSLRQEGVTKPQTTDAW